MDSLFHLCRAIAKYEMLSSFRFVLVGRSPFFFSFEIIYHDSMISKCHYEKGRLENDTMH